MLRPLRLNQMQCGARLAAVLFCSAFFQDLHHPIHVSGRRKVQPTLKMYNCITSKCNLIFVAVSPQHQIFVHIESYTILHNLTQSYTILHDLTQSYTISHNLTQSYTILHNLTKFYTILHPPTHPRTHARTCINTGINTRTNTHRDTCCCFRFSQRLAFKVYGVLFCVEGNFTYEIIDDYLGGCGCNSPCDCGRFFGHPGSPQWPPRAHLRYEK